MKEIKRILQWLISIVLFVVCLISFRVYFSNVGNIKNAIICVVSLLLFCICYWITTKRMTHKDGYTYVQALSFYKKCKKNGVDKKNISKADVERIKPFLKDYDFTKDFTVDQIIEMYVLGYEIYKKMK